MIIHELKASAAPEEVESASQIFIRTEQTAEPPVGIVLQERHSRLAGDIARALNPDVFGDLPDDVLRAIAQHDCGWGESDKDQLKSLPGMPRPFPRLSTEETAGGWQGSVDYGWGLSPLTAVIISRHFDRLGHADPARAELVESERARREPVERMLPYLAEELDRWTSAMGFCDLLSLYLCSGARQTAEFPLAHPADPASETAPKVLLRYGNDGLQFSHRIVRPGTYLSLQALRYEHGSAELQPMSLEWRFVEDGE